MLVRVIMEKCANVSRTVAREKEAVAVKSLEEVKVC